MNKRKKLKTNTHKNVQIDEETEAKSGELVSEKDEKLNLGEKRFLKAIVEGHNAREAAYLAYRVKKDNSADSKGSQVLKRERFQRALEKAGLSDAKLAKAFVQGLEADRPLVINKKIKGYPDHPTRHQFLKTALVVKGYYRRTDDVEESSHDPLIVKSIQMLNQTINVGKD
jgi:hypothetical protein